MSALASLVEVEVVCPIELVQTVQDILACMGVHDVEKDSDAHAMGNIDELFQVFWGPVPRARSEEARDLIPERYAPTKISRQPTFLRGLKRNNTSQGKQVEEDAQA